MSAWCERVKVVPVDGTVMSSEAVIDTSPLGGEPLPRTASRGMADRYAGFFLPATVLVAGLAWV
jgi:cation transport ATPase